MDSARAQHFLSRRDEHRELETRITVLKGRCAKSDKTPYHAVFRISQLAEVAFSTLSSFGNRVAYRGAFGAFVTSAFPGLPLSCNRKTCIEGRAEGESPDQMSNLQNGPPQRNM